MWLYLSVYILGILGFVLHFYLLPISQRTKNKVLELFLLYQIVFSLGITSFFAFIGFTFYDVYVAKYLEWPACPFQQELANVNLAFGVLGVLSIWYRGLFWVATVLGFSIWIFSDGVHHLYHYYFYHNASDGNIGVPLYTDLIVPTLLMVLLIPYWRSFKS